MADDRVLKFLYDADLRHVESSDLSAMSPEIQEWSHKSRFRINNLYLLTRPINVLISLAALTSGFRKFIACVTRCAVCFSIPYSLDSFLADFYSQS